VAPETAAGRADGVAVAIVTNNNDPERLARVRIVTSSKNEAWARVAAPMAGTGRGVQFLPEVGDEVLIAFEGGDPRRPFVLGGLWSASAPPPERGESGASNRKTIRSRSGHVIRLDDTEGGARIEIADAAGNSFVIDGTSNTMMITAQGDLSIESRNGNLRLRGVVVEIEGTRVQVEGQQ
jgi:phage baseplate assembly protein V